METPDSYPNIPLLDREFDTKSSELSAFIFSHSQIRDEGFYSMDSNKSPEISLS
jgi:hypothetical protein